MKIAIVTETYPPQINGVSRTLGRLVEHLARGGHQVLVVHPRYEESAQAGPMADNVKTVQVKAWPLPFYREVLLPRPPFGAYKRALAAFEPDLVHVATEGGLGLSALRLGRRRGWPVVTSYHTNFDAYARHYRLGWAGPLVRLYLRWFHNQGLATFAPSMTICRQLESDGFHSVKLWSRGIDSDLFKPGRPGGGLLRERAGIPGDAVVIGHCGRLAPEKNIFFLADVFAEVLKRDDSAHVMVVGDGPSRTVLEERLRTVPGSTGRVHFTGYLTGAALADAYAAMNAFAFASRTETFGNVLLEAMASGLPVVALGEGGPMDVIQSGVAGLLLPPEAQPQEMAAVLVEWAGNKSEIERLGMAARRHAEATCWEAIMDGLVKDYEATIGGVAE